MLIIIRDTIIVFKHIIILYFKSAGIASAEFITTRNTTKVLEDYSSYLVDEGFTVTFGSEHNTPVMEPVKLRTRDNGDLTATLKEINYCGACRVVAHQSALEGVDDGDAIISGITMQ